MILRTQQTQDVESMLVLRRRRRKPALIQRLASPYKGDDPVTFRPLPWTGSPPDDRGCRGDAPWAVK